jgi:hypothetical protein
VEAFNLKVEGKSIGGGIQLKSGRKKYRWRKSKLNGRE